MSTENSPIKKCRERPLKKKLNKSNALLRSIHRDTYSLNSKNFNSIMKNIKQKINPEIMAAKTNSNLISRNLYQATSITNMRNDQLPVKDRNRSSTKYSNQPMSEEKITTEVPNVNP